MQFLHCAMLSLKVVIDTFKYRILNLKRKKLKIRSKEHSFMINGIKFFHSRAGGKVDSHFN